MGDGKFQLGMVDAYAGYGLLTNDSRALRTALQITEAIFTTGSIVQFLKHITGRESPFVAIQPTGR